VHSHLEQSKNAELAQEKTTFNLCLFYSKQTRLDFEFAEPSLNSLRLAAVLLMF